MEYTFDERKEKIIAGCLKITDTLSPTEIFNRITRCDFVRIHGPEHHLIDGACILTAYRNAGGKLDLDAALAELSCRADKMPGAMCGNWGVCGAVTSIGAALAIIDKTGPLSDDGSWGSHMEYTSAATLKIGRINGPRCCKRDGYIALSEAVAYIEETKGIVLETGNIKCGFSSRNSQCIKEKCPFFTDK